TSIICFSAFDFDICRTLSNTIATYDIKFTGSLRTITFQTSESWVDVFVSASVTGDSTLVTNATISLDQLKRVAEKLNSAAHLGQTGAAPRCHSKTVHQIDFARIAWRSASSASAIATFCVSDWSRHFISISP